MSQLTMGDIRVAVKETISQHGMVAFDTMEDVIVGAPVACMVEPFLTDYEGAMHMGTDQYEFNLYVLIAKKNTREAQHTLDDYLSGRGPKSIREFVFRNSDLGLNGQVDAIVGGLVKNTYNGNFKVSTTSFVGAVLRLCVTVT